MDYLNYTGFTNQPCRCGYHIVELAGKQAVIFQQLDAAKNTSITNVVEALATQVLQGPLRGTNPKTLRFFEYYPAKMLPLSEWLEVSFEIMLPMYRYNNFAARIARMFGVGDGPVAWVVDGPVWHPVGQNVQTILNAHVAPAAAVRSTQIA